MKGVIWLVHEKGSLVHTEVTGDDDLYYRRLMDLGYRVISDEEGERLRAEKKAEMLKPKRRARATR